MEAYRAPCGWSFATIRTRDRTVLHRRRAGGLAHISKPYWNGEVLTVQMVNPTAGIFTGDEMSSQIHVGADARVALTAPSAMRFHTMRTGRATIAQDFRIEDRAWLEFLPEWVIPQRDSDVEQTTRIRLGQSSQLAFFDLLAPGRVAHGECYAYRRYVTTLELHRENQLVVRERMVLSPNDGGWPLRVPGWENCYYGAAWFVGGEGGACMTVLEEVERALQADGFKVWRERTRRGSGGSPDGGQSQPDAAESPHGGSDGDGGGVSPARIESPKDLTKRL